MTGAGAASLDDEGFAHLARLLDYTDTKTFFVAVALGQHSYISLANRMLTESGLADTLGLWRDIVPDAIPQYLRAAALQIIAKIERVCCATLRPCWPIKVCQSPKHRERSWMRNSRRLVEVQISDWLACLELLSHLSYLRGARKVVRYAP